MQLNYYRFLCVAFDVFRTQMRTLIFTRWYLFIFTASSSRLTRVEIDGLSRVFWATHCTADIASRSPPRLRAARSRSQRAERWERSPLLGKFSCDCCNCFREQLGISRISHLVLNTLCSFFKIQFTFTLFLLICHQYKFMINECASFWQFFHKNHVCSECPKWT